MKKTCAEINRDSLKDIQNVKIDTNKSKEDRIKSFVEQIGDPFCFKCDDYVVRISFAEDTNSTLENCLSEFLSTL